MAPVTVVLGAGGPTGFECVKRLLEATTDKVRVHAGGAAAALWRPLARTQGLRRRFRTVAACSRARMDPFRAPPAMTAPAQLLRRAHAPRARFPRPLAGSLNSPPHAPCPPPPLYPRPLPRHPAPRHQVRAVVRDPAKYAEKFPSDARLEVVKGDVTDAPSLAAALAGAKGVIFAASGVGYWSAKDVDYQGVVNTAAAAKAAGADRVVLVSSMLTHPSNRWHPVRILLNNIRYSLMDFKFKSEEALKDSGVSWAVVRPGGLTTGERGTSAIVAGARVGGRAGREAGGTRAARAPLAAARRGGGGGGGCGSPL
jgi:hypothetical protein